MDFGFQNGGSGGGSVPLTLNYGLFTQIDNSIPVVNTITETSLIGNGIGTLSVPENTFKIGDTFFLKMSGKISSRNNDNLTIRLHANGNDIATTGLMTMKNSTKRNWELYAYFVIRQIGGLGIAFLATAGNFSYVADASTSFETYNYNTITNVFDTTVINTLDVVCEWGQADPLNSILSSQTILTKLF